MEDGAFFVVLESQERRLGSLDVGENYFGKTMEM